MRRCEAQSILFDPDTPLTRYNILAVEWFFGDGCENRYKDYVEKLVTMPDDQDGPDT